MSADAVGRRITAGPSQVYTYSSGFAGRFLGQLEQARFPRLTLVGSD
jgi:hypothetical protein